MSQRGLDWVFDAGVAWSPLYFGHEPEDRGFAGDLSRDRLPARSAAGAVGWSSDDDTADDFWSDAKDLHGCHGCAGGR